MQAKTQADTVREESDAYYQWLADVNNQRTIYGYGEANRLQRYKTALQKISGMITPAMLEETNFNDFAFAFREIKKLATSTADRG